LAELLSMLQELQQSAPASYQQVTRQTAASLKDAAQAAQSQGNTAAADRFDLLATDFAEASKSGRLPNIKDLAQAVGSRQHDSYQAAAADSESPSSQTLRTLLAALHPDAPESTR
jgi:hypothetical protein